MCRLRFIATLVAGVTTLATPHALADARDADTTYVAGTITDADSDMSADTWHTATTAVAGVNLRAHACYTLQPYCGHRGRISAGGTSVRIVCQVSGESATGSFGISRIWDYVFVFDETSGRSEGFVADLNIDTGYNWIPGVERCQTN